MPSQVLRTTLPRAVVDHGHGDERVLEPHARERVLRDEHDQRMEAVLLERGGDQRRDVEAGRDVIDRDLLGRAHLLAVLLEARRAGCCR